MAFAVKVTHQVTIGGRNFPIKGVQNFFAIHAQSFMEATTSQLRILAFKGRDLLVDKLLATDPRKGTKRLYRTDDFNSSNEEAPFERDTDEFDPEQMVKELPPRKYPISIENIKPLQLKELTDRHLQKKLRKGEDPRILLATGDYAIGIVVRRVKTRKAGVYYKVTTARRRHRPSGIPLSQIARIHEFGVANMTLPLPGNPETKVTFAYPARPHWKPVFLILQKVAEKMGEDIRAEALKKSLGKIR